MGSTRHGTAEATEGRSVHDPGTLPRARGSDPTAGLGAGDFGLVRLCVRLPNAAGPLSLHRQAAHPRGARAVASALHAAGFERTRVVLQQWNPRLRPSLARIDGRPPDLLFVSGMQIHSAAAYRLITDAWALGEHRPLILAGGAKAIYEPWDFFGLGPDGRRGADVVVTGEEFVLLELLVRILEFQGPRETMRTAFTRARNAGTLQDIPGLVYPRDDRWPCDLVNTGIQRLVQDLDELPLPFDAFGLFEPPHRRATLAPGRSRRTNWDASPWSWRSSPPTAASSTAPTVRSRLTTSSRSALAIPSGSSRRSPASSSGRGSTASSAPTTTSSTIARRSTTSSMP